MLNPREPDLDQYALVEEIGRGGMGVVFRAQDLTTGRQVALKLMSESTDLSLQHRFRREAKILAQLSHPNIVKFDHFGVCGEDMYLVMELVEGRSLSSCLPLSLPRSTEVAIELCDALDHAHQQGVIHRDVKPSNILVTPEGQIKLVDFGLARPLTQSTGHTLTDTNVCVGTPYFTAPETLLHAEPSVQLDIYSLGIVLYNSITNSYPVGHYEPLPGPLGEITRKATAQLPENRFASVSEMRHALVAASSSNIATVMGKRKPAKPANRNWGLGLVLSVAVGGAMLAATGLFSGSSSSSPTETLGANSVPAATPRRNMLVSLDASTKRAELPTEAAAPRNLLDAGIAVSDAKSVRRQAPKKIRVTTPNKRVPTPVSEVPRGHLVVHARPWADVTIEGQTRRAEPPKGASFEPALGRHAVRLHNPGSNRRIERSVHIRRGKHEILRVDMR